MRVLGSEEGSNHVQALRLFSLLIYFIGKGVSEVRERRGRRPRREGDAAAGHVPEAASYERREREKEREMDGGAFFSLLIDSCLCPRERRWGRLVVGETRSKKERGGGWISQRERESFKKFPLNYLFFYQLPPASLYFFHKNVKRKMTK